MQVQCPIVGWRVRPYECNPCNTCALTTSVSFTPCSIQPIQLPPQTATVATCALCLQQSILLVNAHPFGNGIMGKTPGSCMSTCVHVLGPSVDFASLRILFAALLCVYLLPLAPDLPPNRGKADGPEGSAANACKTGWPRSGERLGSRKRRLQNRCGRGGRGGRATREWGPGFPLPLQSKH